MSIKIKHNWDHKEGNSEMFPKWECSVNGLRIGSVYYDNGLYYTSIVDSNREYKNLTEAKYNIIKSFQNWFDGIILN